MKLAIVLTLCCVLTATAKVSSQTITFSGEKVSLLRVFSVIEKQTGYAVAGNVDLLKNRKALSITASNEPLESFLKRALVGQSLKAHIFNKAIIITEDEKLVNVSTNRAPLKEVQDQVNGRITDTTGRALVGSTIRLKGSNISTKTDENGRFKIQAKAGDILVVTHMGYTVKEVQASLEKPLQIQMEASSAVLDEVATVNTGYQRISQRELASAIVQVKMKDIQLESKFSIDQMLSGVIPGLMSLQSSGEPGATPTIRIRGISSIIGGSSPLWVLDGIILEDPVNVNLNNLNSPDAKYLIGNAIAGINANDVETITVLKDASATAIYGARAANGVIVVTTKKGKAGTPQVNYSTSLSLNTRPSYGDFNLMNAGERMQLSKDLIEAGTLYSRVPRNLGYEGLYLDYLNKKTNYEQYSNEVQKMADRNTDWYSLLFRNSLTNNQYINFSGGTAASTYYASAGYSDVQGSAKGSDQKRYSSAVKINSWLSSKINVGVQLNVSKTIGKGFHNSVNPNRYAYETARTLPAFNDDGSNFYYETQQMQQEFTSAAPNEPMLYNIMNEMNKTGASSETATITAQLNLDYKILKNLRYRLLGGYDQSNANSRDWAGEESNYVSTIRRWNPKTLVLGSAEFNASPIPWGGILSNDDQRKESYTLRNGLEFSDSFGGDHLVNALFSQEIRSFKYKGVAQTWYGWQPERGNTISPALTPAYQNSLGSLLPRLTDNISNNLSWIGSVAYTYKNKLTFNTNLRADGSNNFGANPKYRFLPIWSVAGKYTLSNEKFLINSPLVSYLAVRGSYGIQGNIDNGSSPNLIIRVGGKDQLTGMDQSYIQYLANPSLRWEKTKSYNLGLEFGLKNHNSDDGMDFISGTIDAYRKNGNDIIVTRSTSQVLGMNQVKLNGAKVRNEGVEGSIQLVPYQSADFSIMANFNASYNKNTLVEANKDLGITDADKLNGNALIENQPIGSFYSYSYAGLNENSGYPMFYNRSGERRYELYSDETKLVYSGSRIPKWSGGFGMTVRYKSWSASANFQYAKGGVDRLPNFYRANYYAVFDALSNASRELNDRWQTPGDEMLTDIPVVYDKEGYLAANSALGLIPNWNGTVKSPLEIYDRSSIRTAKMDNIRLRNISLHYIVRAEGLKKLKMKSLVFNLQAENIFLIADKAWQGRDPESGASTTPLPKVFTFGLNVGF